MQVTHPYLGPGSWIRVMPERSTRLILDTRTDSGESFVSAYMAEEDSNSDSDTTQSPRIAATYDNRQFYYRRLREGEIDISSPGLAQAHFAAGGTLTLRGGVLEQVFDVENLETVSDSPTYAFRGFDHTVGELSDEIRFGVVKRYEDDDTVSPMFVRIPTPSSSEFAKEYSVVLNSRSDPGMLLDRREGHVVESNGDEATSIVTGEKLRSRVRYGVTPESYTLFEVDINGNYNIDLPDDADEGYNLNVQNSDIKTSAGRDAQHSVGRNLLIDVETKAELEAGSEIELEAPRISHGANASDAAVLGDALHQWLDTSTVLTPMGPASFNPADIARFPALVLSTKNYVE